MVDGVKHQVTYFLCLSFCLYLSSSSLSLCLARSQSLWLTRDVTAEMAVHDRLEQETSTRSD